jgi:hypothetical protein|tara:strand:+ start:2655 stop:2843 length:189 start_codon:yes stop_codon:yes gene_type:complete
MPRYRVTYEIEADDSDGAMDGDQWELIHVLLLDEPEDEEDGQWQEEDGDDVNDRRRELEWNP